MADRDLQILQAIWPQLQIKFHNSESSDQKYNWQANITVQHSQLNRKPDYHDWYWDTVANVCLTPYKPLLQGYCEFDSPHKYTALEDRLKLMEKALSH